MYDVLEKSPAFVVLRACPEQYHFEPCAMVDGVSTVSMRSIGSHRVILRSVSKKLPVFRFFSFTWFYWVANSLGSFSSF